MSHYNTESIYAKQCQMLNTQQRFETRVIAVPRSASKEIAGVDGNKINGLAIETRTNIEFSEEETPKSATRFITLKGLHGDVMKAVAKIDEIVEVEFDKNEVKGVYYVPVPVEKFDDVTGKDGEKIDEIEKKTGVSCDLAREYNINFKTIMLRGSWSQIGHASRIIYDKLGIYPTNPSPSTEALIQSIQMRATIPKPTTSHPYQPHQQVLEVNGFLIKVHDPFTMFGDAVKEFVTVPTDLMTVSLNLWRSSSHALMRFYSEMGYHFDSHDGLKFAARLLQLSVDYEQQTIIDEGWSSAESCNRLRYETAPRTLNIPEMFISHFSRVERFIGLLSQMDSKRFLHILQNLAEVKRGGALKSAAYLFTDNKMKNWFNSLHIKERWDGFVFTRQ